MSNESIIWKTEDRRLAALEEFSKYAEFFEQEDKIEDVSSLVPALPLVDLGALALLLSAYARVTTDFAEKIDAVCGLVQEEIDKKVAMLDDEQPS